MSHRTQNPIQKIIIIVQDPEMTFIVMERGSASSSMFVLFLLTVLVCVCSAEQNHADSDEVKVTDGFGLGGYASGFDISRDFQMFAVAEYSDFTMKTHRLEDGHHLSSFWGFGNDVRVVRFLFSEDGTKLAGAAFEGTIVKVYDRIKGKVLMELRLPMGTGIRSILEVSNFFMGDTKIAAGCHDGTIVVWDIPSGGRIVRQFNFQSGAIHTLAVDQDGSQMFFNLEKDNGIAVSDINLDQDDDVNTFTKLNWDRECVHPRNGKLFKRWYIVGCEDKTARLYDSQTRELKKVFPERELPGLTFAINDDDMLVIGGFDAITDVWNLKTMEQVDSLSFLKIRYPISSVGISPNSSVVVIVSRHILKFWTIDPTKRLTQPNEQQQECKGATKTDSCQA